jgi:hypothetical protein
MRYQELRLECLRLAEKNASNSTSYKEIVLAASLFYAFVTNGIENKDAVLANIVTGKTTLV